MKFILQNEDPEVLIIFYKLSFLFQNFNCSCNDVTSNLILTSKSSGDWICSETSISDDSAGNSIVLLENNLKLFNSNYDFKLIREF